MKKTFKHGFTLAEVLITLAIIGVVAAMTLPTLIQKHQKKVLATRFKQSLSILSQGFQKMMADEGVTNFKDTDWNKNQCYDSVYTKPENSNKKQYVCTEIAKKYFKVVKAVGYDEIQDILPSLKNASDKQKLASGLYKKTSNTDIVTWGGHYILSNGLTFRGGMIDTNGQAGPNMLGYDVFRLHTTDNGIVLPYEFYPAAGPDLVEMAWNDLENVKNEYQNALDSQDSIEEPSVCHEAAELQQYINEMEENGEHDDDAIQYLSELESVCEDERNYLIEQKQGELADLKDQIETYFERYTLEKGDYKTLCKELKKLDYCGAYLYQNGFVMDY